MLHEPDDQRQLNNTTSEMS